MSKSYSKIIILFVLLIFSAAYSATSSGQKAQTGLPKGMVFESSVGESTDAQKSKWADELLQFTAGGHVLGFQKSEMFAVSADHALSVEFIKARPVSPTEEKCLEPKASQQAAQPLSRIAYRNLWDGVTLIYERHGSGVVKSTYQIQPTEIGASNPVDQIRLRYNVPVRIDDDGNLILSFATGEMKESRPVAWQEVDGKRVLADAGYRLLGAQDVGFTAGSYDPRYPLVIDPILTWNTFLGGTGDDSGNSIAVDANGNSYIVGYSSTTWGSPIRPKSGNYDAFVAKLNSSGVLQWNTFLGSDWNDYGYGIAVDASGNVYVSGQSNATWGSPILPFISDPDAFVAKLNNSGVLQWNTFLGGAGRDYSNGVSADSSGNLFVAAQSDATWGTPVNPFVGGPDHFDMCIVKLDTSGTLQWNTFLGGTSNDSAYGIAHDPNGDVFIAGMSRATWGNPLNPYSGLADAVVAKLNGSTGALLWHTFLGQTGYDYAYAITLHEDGNIYIAGSSDATWGSPVNPFAGGASDAFGAALDSTGALQGNTFLGGAGEDSGNFIFVNEDGSIYIGGYSSATWGSPTSPFGGGNSDGYVAKLDDNGVLKWNAFLGGSGDDFGNSLAVDAAAHIYVAGASSVTWGSPVRAYVAGNDAFVAKIVEADDLLGTWDGQGVYFRNSETGAWTGLTSPADVVACGDLSGDGADDLIGTWSGQAWVKDSADGSWSYLAYATRDVAAGDMNGDGRVDFLGTWDGQGVYYKDSVSGAWVQMTSPAEKITAGDLDGDGKADLIGVWTGEGLWVKYSKTGAWGCISYIAPRDFAAGDMNGDGRVDFLGTWDGQGVYYKDSVSGAWVQMTSPADQVTAGDLDGDGVDDLIGIWGGQGLWVKYSKTGTWAQITSAARDIAAGKMSGGAWSSALGSPVELPAPAGGHKDNPGVGLHRDLSDKGPGGKNFAYRTERNLIPQESNLNALRVSGPGEPGFKFIRQENLLPGERTTNKAGKK